ncbi:hypothetical protein LOK49_LG02G04039 [Camellia lanceoleosa]|uniref:Uncharacterized protein n=1 Tax=Camellia lanceoleosa TaxID=1840588 RepID=A0ACC0IIX5_9ERIC|nr:hypothetical protein LOK49_LG02G04039 [Camellia lanceoleosa]
MWMAMAASVWMWRRWWWCGGVHSKFELMLETLYITINIVDRYLASKSVMRGELQLVGIKVNDFVCISDRAYTNEQVLITKKRILGEWRTWCIFRAELGIMNYAIIISCPSMLAASTVYTARCTINKSPTLNDTLKLHTGFLETQLMDCAKLLVSFQQVYWLLLHHD